MTTAFPSEPTTLTARQRDIVDAAIRVFSDHGYRAGTIQMIAKEAGLSQAGLIHHFPNKDAILLAVIEGREQEDLNVLLPAFARREPVLDTFAKVLAKNAKRPELMRLFAVLSAEALNVDHPAHQYFRDRYDYIVDTTTAAVKNNQADGILRDDVAADEIARLVVGACDGLRYQMLIGSDPVEHWRHIESLRRLAVPPTPE